MKWYERDKQRLLVERALLARFYPDARMLLHAGQVRVLLNVLGKLGDYLVRIDYPEMFPFEPPEAFPVEPVIDKAPHQFRGGRLCLHAIDVTGPQTSGKVICDWVVGWIASYETWVQQGRRIFPSTNRRRRRDNDAEA